MVVIVAVVVLIALAVLSGAGAGAVALAVALTSSFVWVNFCGSVATATFLDVVTAVASMPGCSCKLEWNGLLLMVITCLVGVVVVNVKPTVNEISMKCVNGQKTHKLRNSKITKSTI